MSPETTLHEVGTRLASLLPGLDDPDLVAFDQTIGYSMHLLDSLEKSEANELLTADIRHKLWLLRHGLVTALTPLRLHPEEKSRWAQMLDDVSGVAYSRGEALKTENASIRSRRKSKKAHSHAIREARDFHGQLEVFNKLMNEGPAKEEEVDTEVAVVKKILEEGQWWDSEWRKIRDTRKFEGLKLLPEEVAYGVTRFPVVLVGCKITPRLKKQLAELGMNTSTFFFQYTILHNCRLLGIRSDLLPGNAAFVQQVATKVLDRARGEDPHLREYAMARASRKSKGSHTYFMVFPARLNFNFRDWDFADPKQMGNAA